MIENKVSKFLEHHSFNLQGKSFAVGVSGGPDSLALLHFLWSLQRKLDFRIVVAHFDHMFRGEESYQEALFVQDFCKERGILFEMQQADVSRYVEESGKSSQVAARELRYQFYSEVMKMYNLEYLALGHHGDDQVETVLMRLTRGSSGKARAGIPFLRSFEDGYLVRPFLCLTKRELEEYCRYHQLDPRRDPSNEKEGYSRNRFRKHVLPFLKGENPLVNEHFQRFSEELESDEVYLTELTTRKMNIVMKKENEKITLDISSFHAMPMPLQRRGIKLILNYLYEVQPSTLSAVHIESIFSIIRSPHPSGTLDFPNGLKITRSYGDLHFDFHPSEWQPFRYELNGPGLVTLPGGGLIEADYWSGDAEKPHDLMSFLVNISETDLPLIIRARKTGDRMELKGMPGTRKIKDVFIDKKIPISARDKWPVVTDRHDNILWLPGLKKSNHLIGDGMEPDKILQLHYKQ